MTDRPALYRATSLIPRVQTSGDGLTIEGYLTVFDEIIRVWDPYIGDYYEQIDPKAFNKTLKERTPIMLWNHGYDVTGRVPVGVWNNVRADERGIYGVGRLFNNDLVKPVRDAIEGGAVTGQSITFYPVADKRQENYRDGLPLITRKEVRLEEGGPVTIPAYQSTTVGVRSLAWATGRPQSFRDGMMESTAHPLSARQVSLRAAVEGVTEVFGQFDQTSGPDGAHYMAPSPFPDLQCANCAFFEGPRGCEIVAGDIAPDAVCKFWIIPGDLVTTREQSTEIPATSRHVAPDAAPLAGSNTPTPDPSEGTTSRATAATEAASPDPFVAEILRRNLLEEFNHEH